MIDSKEGASQFQFKDPTVSREIFWDNPNYDHNSKAEQMLYFTTKVFNQQKSGNNYEAEVSLLVSNSQAPFEINHMSSDLPYLVSVVMTSTFYWDKKVSEEQVPFLIKTNAPAMLLAYIRPVVTQLTIMSKYGPQQVPFINFQDSVPQDSGETF